jgi:cytochrome b6-f complex iron-sulfur subunit
MSKHPSTTGSHWLLRLFPKRWRERYGDEFLALIEERQPGLRDTLDILTSALDARVRPGAWLPRSEPERGVVLQAASGPSQPAPPAPGTTLRVGGSSAQSPHPQHPRRFTRRTFLRNALAGSVVVATAGVGVSLYEFTRPTTTGPFGQEIVVPPDLIPAAGAAPYKDLSGKFWLINNADGALALYWKCPHLGCTVPWNEEEGQFHCPCHHSQYDRHGVVTGGPAPRPMDLMAMRVDPQGNVIVDTGEITERDGYTPEQSVPLGG